MSATAGHDAMNARIRGDRGGPQRVGHLTGHNLNSLIRQRAGRGAHLVANADPPDDDQQPPAPYGSADGGAGINSPATQPKTLGQAINDAVRAVADAQDLFAGGIPRAN